MSNPKIYAIDLEAFRKRLIIRSGFIFLVNFSLLTWTVWSASKENLLNSIAICSVLILAIGLFLHKNFLRQLDILKNNYLEINNHILQWYTGTGHCTTINLKRVEKIERDIYQGFDRFLLFEGKTSHPILNLKESNQFQKEVELFTNLKAEIFIFDWKKNIYRGIAFFFPAIISFLLNFLKLLEMRLFFIVLTVNSIFFLFHFSEKRTRGGFSQSTVRRSSIILVSLLAYQILILANE